MAQRSSRSKKKRARYTPARDGASRTGTSRAAKAARSADRKAAATRSSSTGERVRVRPASALGVLLQFVVAWLGVAAVAGLGLYLDRWNTLSYPDSLWLYVAFGAVAVAPAVGAVARARSDADSWGAQALLVPMGMLVAEIVIGPGCPDGGSCASVGARGALGLPLSLLLVAGLAMASWLIGGFAYRRAVARRPRSGRVSLGIALAGMLFFLVALGAPITLALTSADILLRNTPQLVERAKDDVTQICFPISPNDPDLAVRANPEGTYSNWTSLLVRNQNETRTGLSGKKLSGDWNSLKTAHPYEASVIYDENGERAVPIQCRKVVPSSGTVVAADVEQGKIEESETAAIDPITGGDSLQLYPQFFSQPISSIEATRKDTAKKAKEAAAKAKKESAKEKPAAKDTKPAAK